MEKGLIVVVSGPSGCGKGTVNQKLIASGEYAFSVSATTRAPREGEVDGVNYHYITKEDFEKRIERGEMFEYTQYCGNHYYGTLRSEAEAYLAAGKNLILEIEVEGALNVKRMHPEAILIMMLPPSYAALEARLRGRASESEEDIVKRLNRAKEEVKFISQYDYLVYNYDGRADECADEIRAIVRAEKNSMKRQTLLPDGWS